MEFGEEMKKCTPRLERPWEDSPSRQVRSHANQTLSLSATAYPYTVCRQASNESRNDQTCSDHVLLLKFFAGKFLGQRSARLSSYGPCRRRCGGQPHVSRWRDQRFANFQLNMSRSCSWKTLSVQQERHGDVSAALVKCTWWFDG